MLQSLLFSTISFAVCISISPSKVYDDVEYYSSRSNYEFQNETIFCNALRCIIECNHIQSCSNSNIFAFENQQLTVKCTGNNSCTNSHINAPTASTVNIYCYQNNNSTHSTCAEMNVFCPSDANTCSISGSLCNDLQITIKNWIFDDHYLNIDCVTNKINERGTTVSCNTKYTKSELFYNSITSNIECKYNNNKYCCPFRPNTAQNNGSCSEINDSQCNVLCDFSHEKDGCSYRLLQSKNDNTSLNVACTRYGSCDNTIIYCPLYANCTFLCTIHESCGSVQIISHNEGTSTVDITCVDAGGGYDVCIGALIHAPKVHTLNMTFSGAHNVVVIATDVSHLVSAAFLPYTSSNIIYAEYAQNVTIQSFGRFSWYGESHVFANYSNALSVWCNAYYSQDERGRSHATNTSCNDVNIYRFSVLSKSRLKCDSFGCGNLTIAAITGLRDFVVEYNGYGACHSLQQCFEKENVHWNVKCVDVDRNTLVSDVFNGVNCVSGICCDDSLENSFLNIEDKCLDLSDTVIFKPKSEL